MNIRRLPMTLSLTMLLVTFLPGCWWMVAADKPVLYSKEDLIDMFEAVPKTYEITDESGNVLELSIEANLLNVTYDSDTDDTSPEYVEMFNNKTAQYSPTLYHILAPLSEFVPSAFAAVDPYHKEYIAFKSTITIQVTSPTGEQLYSSTLDDIDSEFHAGDYGYDFETIYIHQIDEGMPNLQFIMKRLNNKAFNIRRLPGKPMYMLLDEEFSFGVYVSEPFPVEVDMGMMTDDMDVQEDMSDVVDM